MIHTQYHFEYFYRYNTSSIKTLSAAKCCIGNNKNINYLSPFDRKHEINDDVYRKARSTRPKCYIFIYNKKIPEALVTESAHASNTLKTTYIQFGPSSIEFRHAPRP